MTVEGFVLKICKSTPTNAHTVNYGDPPNSLIVFLANTMGSAFMYMQRLTRGLHSYQQRVRVHLGHTHIALLVVTLRTLAREIVLPLTLSYSRAWWVGFHVLRILLNIVKI